MKKYRPLLSIAILALFAVLFTACGSDEKSAELPDYEGWGKYSYGHFVYHYPEGNFWGREENISRLSEAFERYLAEDCDFLTTEIPEDTIHFYIHNSIEDGRKLTGRDLPFHTDNQIHWGRKTPFGLELARFLIDKWGIRRTDFDFLYEGLATLRDYAGLDYHHQTAALLQMKRYIPLDSLIDNDTFERLTALGKPTDASIKIGGTGPNDPLIATYCRWEAASFVAFITYNYGINRFKMLWQSTASFEKAIRELFNMDLKTFEDKWLAFAMLRYDGTEGEDNVLDSAVQNQ